MSRQARSSWRTCDVLHRAMMAHARNTGMALPYQHRVNGQFKTLQQRLPALLKQMQQEMLGRHVVERPTNHSPMPHAWVSCLARKQARSLDVAQGDSTWTT